MGQYFIVANTTKKEYLHPHKFGSGMKFLEFTMDGTSVMTGLAHLLGQSSDGVTPHDTELIGSWIGDHVVIVGDYDISGLFDEAYDTYTDISDKVVAQICYDAYAHSVLKGRMRWDGTGKSPVTA